MSEIKTCEQFVLAELENERAKSEFLQKDLDIAKMKIAEMHADLMSVLQHVKLCNEGANAERFEFGIWRLYDTQAFDEITAVCHKYMPEQNEGVEDDE